MQILNLQISGEISMKNKHENVGENVLLSYKYFKTEKANVAKL